MRKTRHQEVTNIRKQNKTKQTMLTSSGEGKKKKRIWIQSELCRHRHDILSSWNMHTIHYQTLTRWIGVVLHKRKLVSLSQPQWIVSGHQPCSRPIPKLWKQSEMGVGGGRGGTTSNFVLIFFSFFYMPEGGKAVHITHSRHGSAVVGESDCLLPEIHYENVTNDLSMFSQVNKANLNCLCV